MLTYIEKYDKIPWDKVLEDILEVYGEEKKIRIDIRNNI